MVSCSEVLCVELEVAKVKVRAKLKYCQRRCEWVDYE